MPLKLKKSFFDVVLSLLIVCLVTVWISFSSNMLLQSDNIMLLERDIFFQTAVSIIEDGDLNSVNQIPAKNRWLVSKTYNHADVREYGGFVAWVPFILIGKLFSFSPAVDQDLNLRFAQALATLIYSILSILLAFKILVLMFPYFEAQKRWLFFLFFCPVFFWYTFFEFSGSDIISNFFISLCLYILLKDQKPTAYISLLVGAGLALCLWVKIHVLFYIPIFFFYMIQNWGRRHLLIAISGFVLLGMAGLINMWFRFGFIGTHYAEASVLFTRHFLPFMSIAENLFGRNGLITNNPTTIFGFLGLFTMVIKTSRNLRPPHETMLRLICISIWVTILSTSFRPITEELLGGRQLLGQFIFVILAATFAATSLNLDRSKLLKHLLFFSCAYTLLVSTQYLANKDLFVSHGVSFIWSDISSNWGRAQKILGKISISSWKISLTWGLALVILTFVGVKFYRKIQFHYILAFFVVIYLGSTLANAFLNQKNVRQLQSQQFFDQISVGNCMDIFLWDDMMSAMRNVRIRWQNQNTRALQAVDEFEKDFAKHAIACLLEDRHAIRRGFEEGILRPATGF